jgi:ribosomal-protein-alanine N-acetyltransferase
MTKQDIPQVTDIDREAFPTMWPPVNFNHEMTNRLAYYMVACDGNPATGVIETANTIEKQVSSRSLFGFKWPFSLKTSSGIQTSPEKVEYIAGFVGLWLLVDEAHIINIAVRESYRGRGIGELLMISCIEKSAQLKAKVVTLEVRSSNTIAQNLYTKYGFKKTGLRRGYYTDNKEDAFIMTTDLITLKSYREHFLQLKEAHFQKMGDIEYQIN